MICLGDGVGEKTYVCSVSRDLSKMLDDPCGSRTRALEKLVEKYPDHRFPYSLGQDTLDWYFELGDLINDKIVVRYIFEVPDEVLDQANVRTVRTEIDSILHRLHTMAVAFTDFAGHFIWHCMKKW